MCIIGVCCGAHVRGRTRLCAGGHAAAALNELGTNIKMSPNGQYTIVASKTYVFC